MELTITGFSEVTTSPATTYHKEITIYHAVPNSLDVNNTNIYINMPDMG